MGLFTYKGLVGDGIQVIPVSIWFGAWIPERKTATVWDRGYQDHYQMTSNGKAFCHLGVGGQMLYANSESKVVVVQLSTTSMPSNGDLDLANALYNIAEAIDHFLI